MLWQLASCVWREYMNIADLIESSMCLTTRMELTGWYYRDQDVTNQRHLNNF
jgi:hypothetical protein